MEGKKISDSHVVMSQLMSPQDANVAGNVHGGVIMKLIDTAAGVVAIRHARSNVVTAYITYVALDRNGRPMPLVPLILETEEEVRRNREAKARRETRLAEKRQEKACQLKADDCR